MTRSGQLDLFGPPPPGPPEHQVGSAPVSDTIRRLAGDLPPAIRLGTSSWSFPGWAGLVYDRRASQTTLARRGLEAYARHPLLGAVGVDRTFYAPIPVEAFAAYAGMVPDGFRFVVKAAGQCTTPWSRDAHGRPAGDNPLFLDAAFAAEEVVGPYVEGLGDKAGALVFQFPPQGRRLTADPPRFAERLAAFFARLPAGPTYRVELRDRKLFGTDYLGALESSGVAHCVSVHPRMPPPADQCRATNAADEGPLVVRWMLGAGLDYEQAKERYRPFDRLVDEDPTTRGTLARVAVEKTARGRTVLLIANNKAEGSAPRTLARLAEAIVALRNPENPE